MPFMDANADICGCFTCERRVPVNAMAVITATDQPYWAGHPCLPNPVCLVFGVWLMSGVEGRRVSDINEVLVEIQPPDCHSRAGGVGSAPGPEPTTQKGRSYSLFPGLFTECGTREKVISAIGRRLKKGIFFCTPIKHLQIPLPST